MVNDIVSINGKVSGFISPAYVQIKCDKSGEILAVDPKCVLFIGRPELEIKMTKEQLHNIIERMQYSQTLDIDRVWSELVTNK